MSEAMGEKVKLQLEERTYGYRNETSVGKRKLRLVR